MFYLLKVHPSFPLLGGRGGGAKWDSQIRADRDALNTLIHGVVIYCSEMIYHVNILKRNFAGLHHA